MVVANDIVRACEPNTCRCLISVEKTPRTAHIDNKIVFDEVLRLCTVFDEDGMSHSVVSHVVLDPQVMYTMDGHGTIEGVMDGIVTHVRRVHCADHMEMNGITS